MDRRVKKAHTIIKRNYRDKLLLDTLAAKVGLSKYHLHRLFKAEFLQTPAECLLGTRLELARHYLKLKTQMTMTELALECGFSSLAVFSRAFSKRFGITPTEMLREDELRPDVKDYNKTVEVVHLPEIKLCYETTEFFSQHLKYAFDLSLQRARSLDFQTTSRKIGVMNHLSIHEINYYASVEISGMKNMAQLDKVMVIESGKYASFVIDSERYSFIEELVNFKNNWLDPSGYIVRELFALEEFLDDTFRVRKIFVPIKHK